MMQSRIYLRALEPDDYKISIHWRKNERIWSMVGGVHYYVSEAYEKQWVEKKIFDPKPNEIILAVCLAGNDQYIGNIYLTDVDYINRHAQFHILLGDESVWGKGYGVEATSLMLNYGFNERNLHRIYSQVLTSNTASMKMHKTCGFVQEGVKRQAVYKNGKYHDVAMMGIIVNEYGKK